jgi:hypothetical protein
VSKRRSVAQTRGGACPVRRTGGGSRTPSTPGQEHSPEGHEPERRGTAHALKEHPARDQHADGQDAGDQAHRGIGLTALRGRKEITQPGHHGQDIEGAAEIGHKHRPKDTGQGGDQRERDQPGHRQGDADQDPGFPASPARPRVVTPHAGPGMDHDIDHVIPGHDKKRETRRERKPDQRRMQTRGVVPQRMPRLEQHGHKRVKDQPGQGRRIRDQAEEQRATPAEGLHTGSFTPLACSSPASGVWGHSSAPTAPSRERSQRRDGEHTQLIASKLAGPQGR